MPLWPVQRRTPRLLSVPNSKYWYEMTGVAPLYTEGAWSTANLAVYTPIVVTEMIPRAYLLLGLGTGAEGNGAFDIGLYRCDSEGKPGERIGHTGSFVWTATPAVSSFLAVSLPPLSPGTYWLAASSSGAVDTIVRIGVAAVDGLAVAVGVYTQASAFPLPATATPSSTPVAANIPLMALVSY